jgi:thiamine-monophosphate kinase
VRRSTISAASHGPEIEIPRGENAREHPEGRFGEDGMREFDLLRRVYEANEALGERVTLPPGDDMGAVRLLSGANVLLAVDQLVAGRHYDPNVVTMRQAGRKAIARSASDIAAMAARPSASLAAVVLPKGMAESDAIELFDGMREAADEFGCPLMGGDLAEHGDPGHPLVCSITVLAEPGPAGMVGRGGARIGDGVYVSGELGGSYDENGLGRHLTFTPRIREGLALAEALCDRLHAMIDVSDGLGRDASHIAEMSGVRIEIDATAIPCRAGRAWEDAVKDGEDYELLFTSDVPVPGEVGGVPVRRIGTVVERAEGDGEPGKVIVVDGPRRTAIDDRGWQHGS